MKNFGFNDRCEKCHGTLTSGGDCQRGCGPANIITDSDPWILDDLVAEDICRSLEGLKERLSGYRGRPGKDSEQYYKNAVQKISEAKAALFAYIACLNK